MRYLAPLLLTCIVIGCTAPGPTAEEKILILDSLKLRYSSIGDSINLAWEKMVADDDQKLAYMKRLIDEVTYTNEYNAVDVQEYYDRIESTKAMRYDMVTMAESDLIDEYDLAIQSLISEIETFARTHPKFDKYPLMLELINDIRSADGRVLFMRVNYDDFAKEKNSLIQNNPEYGKDIDPDNFVKSPLFELAE